MTVDSSIATAEAQAKAVETETISFWDKYKTVIYVALACIVGAVLGHKI